MYRFKPAIEMRFVFYILLPLFFNPLSAGIFTVLDLVIRGQSVIQESMGHDAPRYPPGGSGL